MSDRVDRWRSHIVIEYGDQVADEDHNQRDVIDITENTEVQSGTALLLVVLSVLGVGVGYAASIAAARILGAAAFENYAVAVATLGLLATVAEAGVGKYALKVMPAYGVSREWALAAGYWRFSLWVCLSVSMCIAVSVATWEGMKNDSSWEYPLGIAALFIPAAALFGVGVDFVMASRAAVTGTLIARLVVPGATLMLLVAAGNWFITVEAGMAMMCFGTSSVIGACLCTIIFRRTSPRQVFETPPKYRRTEWSRECSYFLGISFLMSWILRVSLVILELLPVPETEVGYFAAALETGCLILLLSKSTDKLFQPEMSVILQERNIEQGIRLRNKRYLFVGSGCGVFMLVMLIFGREILGLYGADFRAGYFALCFVSAGTCTWTMFSLAPVYLRFVGRSVVVIKVTIVAAIMMAILTGVLGVKFGATGAGVAFCTVLCTVALTFLLVARRDFFSRQPPDSHRTYDGGTAEED